MDLLHRKRKSESNMTSFIEGYESMLDIGMKSNAIKFQGNK